MIAQTIQLALAPVFVLVAIGNIFNVLNTRLARVVDRTRLLQTRHAQTSGAEHDGVVLELRHLDQRIHLISRAILLLVLSGLSIGLTVVVLFLGQIAHLAFQNVVAATFLLAVLLLMSALVYFLREVRQSTLHLRLAPDLLEWEAPAGED